MQLLPKTLIPRGERERSVLKSTSASIVGGFSIRGVTIGSRDLQTSGETAHLQRLAGEKVSNGWAARAFRPVFGARSLPLTLFRARTESRSRVSQRNGRYPPTSGRETRTRRTAPNKPGAEKEGRERSAPNTPENSTIRDLSGDAPDYTPCSPERDGKNGLHRYNFRNSGRRKCFSGGA